MQHPKDVENHCNSLKMHVVFEKRGNRDEVRNSIPASLPDTRLSIPQLTLRSPMGAGG
jgi:hypothetical protein